MHATIDGRFECSIDDEKTLPVTALAEFITEQDVEATILEAIIEQFEEQQVEEYCGEKHTDGNDTKRFQRAATKQRSAVTTAGEIKPTLHYVEDAAADEDEASYFRPVEDLVTFDGQKQYQEDISLQSVNRATDLSYRDAADGDGSVSLPSSSTFNRRVTEYCGRLSKFLRDRLAGTEAETVGPDETKCHNQDEDRAYQNGNIPLEQPTDEGETTLLYVSVDESSGGTASTVDDIDTLSE